MQGSRNPEGWMHGSHNPRGADARRSHSPGGRMQSSRNPRGTDAGRSPDPAGRMQVAAGSHWTSDRTQTQRQTQQTRRDSVKVELRANATSR